MDSGTFEGYAAVFNNVDYGADVIHPGAFKKTIKEGMPKKRIKVLWLHQYPFGMPTFMEEDGKGLHVIGKPSNTQENRDRLEYMRDGVVDGLSIGYTAIKTDLSEPEGGQKIEDGTYMWEGSKVRNIREAKLHEFSPVIFPMNPQAAVERIKSGAGLQGVENTFSIEFNEKMGLFLPAIERMEAMLKKMAPDEQKKDAKGATAFINLPLATRTRAWDANAAEERVREWSGSGEDDAPNSNYRKAFMWYDADEPDNFGSYKLQYADVIDDTLTAIPRAVFAIAAVLQGSRGGVDISDDDAEAVMRHVEKYYALMREEFDDDSIVAPWDKSKSDPMLLDLSTVKLSRLGQVADSCKKFSDDLTALINESQPDENTGKTDEPHEGKEDENDKDQKELESLVSGMLRKLDTIKDSLGTSR